MLPRRINRNDEHSAFTHSERQLILAAETLRGGDTAEREPKKEDRSNEEKISLFWRVFGGTILSIFALVIINAYQSMANSIHEVRADVGRLRETSSEFIKKDEFNSRSTTIWNRVQELQSVNATITVLTTKLSSVEQQLGAVEAEKKEIGRELLQLRERLAKIEGRDEAKPVKPAVPPATGAGGNDSDH